MSDRMKEMRKRLREILESLGTPGDWSHITRQTGLYTYTGLNGKFDDLQKTNLICIYLIYD